MGFNRVFTSVQALGIGDGELTLELVQGIRSIVLRQPHESQQPVQSQCWIPLSPADLAILDGGSLPEHGLGVGEVAARDVDHGDLEVRVREVGIQGEHAGCTSTFSVILNPASLPASVLRRL